MPKQSTLAASVFAFIALPGVIAYLIPFVAGRVLGHGAPNAVTWQQMIGTLLIIMGTVLLVSCTLEFHAIGKGTLGPWQPPVNLVTSGPYRFSRNPMYVGVLAIVAGWTCFWLSKPLAAYLLLLAGGFQLRVLIAEEPWAARSFGQAWDDYRSKVPRWLI